MESRYCGSPRLPQAKILTQWIPFRGGRKKNKCILCTPLQKEMHVFIEMQCSLSSLGCFLHPKAIQK